MARAWNKLGIVAGWGALPRALADHCARTRVPYFVARVAPFAEEELNAHPGVTHAAAAFGQRIAALKAAGCDAVVFAGVVRRPDFTALSITPEDAAVIARIAAASPQGDDALMRAVIAVHVEEGFSVIGPDEIVADMVAPPGALGALAPDPRAMRDIRRAAHVIAGIGAFDIGQAVVVCEGLVLGVEAQEGTDGLIARIAELPLDIRGTPEARRGVLVKRPKPNQERRIDLPMMGARTVAGAARAGLAGVAVEAGGAFIVEREDAIAAADAAGLFIYGFRAAELDQA